MYDEKMKSYENNNSVTLHLLAFSVANCDTFLDP